MFNHGRRTRERNGKDSYYLVLVSSGELSGSIFYYIGLCGKTPDENSLKDSMVNQEFGGRLTRTTGAQKATFNVQISFFLLCGHIYYIYFFCHIYVS